MAKASWLTQVEPSSGSGSKTITVGAEERTGRDARQTTLTITSAGLEDTTVTVNQKGAVESISQDSTATAAKTGQTVTINGVSNSKSVTYTLGSGALEVTLPENYTANGMSVKNGEEISGDPGAESKYDFSITLTIPENETIEEKSRQIIVTAAGGQTAICTLTQAQGDAYLTVSVTELTLEADGTAKSFDITSNASWVIA